MSNALKDIIEYAMSVSMDDTNTPEAIMRREEDEYIAVNMNEIPYAESQGFRFCGTLAELMTI